MNTFEASEVTIQGEDFARLLRDALIQRGIVPPLGHEIRDEYEYEFAVLDPERTGTTYILQISRKKKEKTPEPKPEYQAGDWKDSEVDKIIEEN
jgi:hypothetical protein